MPDPGRVYTTLGGKGLTVINLRCCFLFLFFLRCNFGCVAVFLRCCYFFALLFLFCAAVFVALQYFFALQIWRCRSNLGKVSVDGDLGCFGQVRG